ncbi:MAG TPA: hypothetical protein VNJ11_04445 [Bryobacteraceae bacterium]|nr:hypothetical protein [Bryobacteraceae bacterium]
MRRGLPLWLICAVGCCGQGWELGVAAGYGIYRGGSVFAPAGKVQAGVRNRFAVSAFLAENREWIAGEFRYTYQDGDPFLASDGLRTNIQGQSHAFHYDLVVFLSAPSRRIRPYLAAGLGAKLYEVTGPENPDAPLQLVGRLRSRDQFTFLASGGGGLKVRLRRGLLLRVDFRDYMTPFPKRLIEPAPLATPRGIFHQFTPLVGLSYALSRD